MFKMSVVPLFLLAGCLLFVRCGESKPETPNLALKKNAVASSFEKANQYNGNVDSIAAFAVDGDRKTRWSSDYFNDSVPDNAWIYVDLGQKTTVKTVLIYWEDAFAKDFNIEVSDDANSWTTVAKIDNNKSKNVTVNLDKPVETRYVKIDCKKRFTQYGYSIFEIEIY